MLVDAGVRLLVTRQALLTALPAAARAGDLFCFDADAARLARESREPLRETAPAESLAYLIFTSGSTGRPMAVGVSRGTLAAHIPGMVGAFGLHADDRVLQFASLSFDVALEQILDSRRGGHAGDARRGGVERGGARPPSPRAGADGRQPADRLLAGVAAADGWLCGRLSAADDRGWRCDGSRRRPELAGAAGPARLLNAYGPTEGVITASVWEVARRDPGSLVPVGRALPGRRLYVLDPAGTPVPPGVAGELHLSGPLLARGYLGRPEATAEKFIPDPFAERPGDRLYRTGDRARWRPDGVIEYLGRTDHQVKVRGFRVELGEIEETLGRVPGVSHAAVVVREDRPGDRRLVAYAVAKHGSSLVWSEVRQDLARGLPEHMLPSALVLLATLPLTPNGKVDRRALPAPERETVSEVAPRTPVEELLAEIWADVLGVERVGVEESFFDLGGHSLLATRVTSRLRTTFGVELPLRALFEAPTVAGLAARIEAAVRAGAGAAPAIRVAPRTGPLPLSFAQQRLWFIDQLEPGSPLYNVPVALRVAGALSASVLARTLGEIVRRHEVLRTIFSSSDGAPVQRVQPAVPLALPVIDLSALPAPVREELPFPLVSAEASRPFDLTRGPLLRVTLLRMRGDDHVALLVMHHIVSDGWSMSLMVREITALYAAYAAGSSSPLPELPVQYADFATWQREELRGELLEAQMAYWRRQLAGLPPALELPTDRPRSPQQGSGGGLRRVSLPAALVRRVQALGRRQGVTPFMALLAVFQLLLSRYSGQSDLAVGTPVAGRTRQELEGLIGFFVNTLVLRGDLTAGPSFRELLLRVRETALAAHTHQEVPFEKLVEELAPERSLVHSPLFQVMFSLDHAAAARLEIAGLRLRSFAAAETTAKFELTLAVEEWGE